MLLILNNWKVQKTCRSFCRDWSRRRIKTHLIIWIAFYQVELICELKMKICCSPLTSDDGMLIIIETTAALSFTYFKERSKIKALGDKFVLRSTSVVNVSHGRICAGEFCPSATGTSLVWGRLGLLRPEAQAADSGVSRLAGIVVSPNLFSSLPTVCDLWFPEVDMLSFYIIVPVKIFRHKLVWLLCKPVWELLLNIFTWCLCEDGIEFPRLMVFSEKAPLKPS